MKDFETTLMQMTRYELQQYAQSFTSMPGILYNPLTKCGIRGYEWHFDKIVKVCIKTGICPYL